MNINTKIKWLFEETKDVGEIQKAKEYTTTKARDKNVHTQMLKKVSSPLLTSHQEVV